MDNVDNVTKTNIFEKLIIISGIICCAAFFTSLILVANITGSAVGASKERFYDLFFLLVVSFIWSMIVVFWYISNRKKRFKKVVNIKKLLEEVERIDNQDI